jgi:hypothetical protein
MTLKNTIVLVPFPLDDLSGSKVRPCICLTDAIGLYQHVIVAFITSQISKANEQSDLVATIIELLRGSILRIVPLKTDPLSNFYEN